jgi:NADH-quinone oxidoreductase subunit N
MLFVGFGFKLSAVPFHFWVPDVFEGAAAEVGAFLSVASKAAAVGLTARVLQMLHISLESREPLVLVQSVGIGVLIVAGLTATLGNLAALAQTNLKRLLAYSTIAHAGYMLMGLACLTRESNSALLFYIAAYLLMNLGAFAVVAIVRNRTGLETIDASRGLLARSPLTGVAMIAFLLSLLGLPPLAGFAGKFQVFSAIYEAGRDAYEAGLPQIGLAYRILLGIGVINTAISAGYYLKVLRVIGLDEPAEKDEKGRALPLGESNGLTFFVLVLAVALVILGIWWAPLSDLASVSVIRLR